MAARISKKIPKKPVKGSRTAQIKRSSTTPSPHIRPPKIILPEPPLEVDFDFSRLVVPEKPVSSPPPPPPQVVLVEPDPCHPTLAVVFLLAAQRMLAFAQEHRDESIPEVFVRATLARVIMKDPKVKLYVALDASTGEVLGHSVTTIETNGASSWAFCWQAQTDKPHTGVIQQMLDTGAPWAKAHGAVKMLVATQIDPRFWSEKYNFQLSRSIMSRAL